jgi:hypothetical protein
VADAYPCGVCNTHRKGVGHGPPLRAAVLLLPLSFVVLELLPFPFLPALPFAVLSSVVCSGRLSVAGLVVLFRCPCRCVPSPVVVCCVVMSHIIRAPAPDGSSERRLTAADAEKPRGW